MVLRAIEKCAVAPRNEVFVDTLIGNGSSESAGKGAGGEFCPPAPSVPLYPGEFMRACAIG